MSPYSIAVRLLGAVRRRLRRRVTRRDAARFARSCRDEGARPAAILLLERLGDFVAASAIVAGVRERHPELRIAWFGRARYRELALLVPGVDHYVDVDCYGELADVVAALGDWRLFDLNLNGKQCPCCAEPWRNRTGDAPIDTENYYDHGPLAAAFAQVAGLPWRPGAPTLRAPAQVTPPRPPGRYVVVHSESEESARNWHEQGWRRLATWLLENTDLTIAHVGVRPASWLPNHERARDLAGETDQAQLLALVADCSLFVGIDSSVANLANAFGRPGLVLLGRYRRFARYLPYTGRYALDETGGAALVVRHLSECPYLPYPVVERALRAVARRVREGRPAGPGGAWDVRAHELPSDCDVAQDATPDVAVMLTVADVRGTADWRHRWPGAVADLVFALPAAALADADDEQLELLESSGARFVALPDPERTVPARVTESYRYARRHGEPVRLDDADRAPELRAPDDDGGAALPADGMRWYAADVRDLTPAASQPLLTQLHERARADRARAFGALAEDAEVTPRSGGLKAGVDRIERDRDGALRAIHGWLFLENTHSPPADYCLAVARPDGSYEARRCAPFSRLERPDVAQAFDAPGATFSGMRIDVPDELRGAGVDVDVLVSDRAAGAWRRLELP